MPENLYLRKGKDYIFYVNKRLSSPLCVCLCVYVCERLTVVHNRSQRVCACETVCVGVYVYVSVNKRERDITDDSVC